MQTGFFAGLLAAALAVTLWGVQLPVAKDAFATLDLFHMTSIRYVIPSLCMALVLLGLEGRSSLRYGQALLPATVLGVLGLSASPLLVFIGMSLSRAEHAAVIVALQPSIAAIALWYLRGIVPSRFTIFCIAAAFVGVMLVVTRGRFIFIESPRELFGDFIVFLGAACWVFYTMGTSRLKGWSIWRITVLTMIPGACATVMLTELLVALEIVPRPSFQQVTAVGWELTYLAFGGVVLAMLAWNWGNRRIGPLNATLLINLMPVVTFLFRTVQGHRFELIELYGAGLVVAALIANNLYLRAEFRRTNAPMV